MIFPCHRSSLSEVPYLLHADDSSFFSARGAEKLIADHIQFHLMNYLHAFNYFFAAISHVGVNYDSPCGFFFFMSDAKMQVLGSIKSNIQKLAVDDIFPIGVILMGRV